MKTLLLLRHAKSGWDTPSQRDFDRSLNVQGRAAAKAIGKHFRSRKIVPEAILCSPAQRTRETLTLVDENAQLHGAPIFVDDIYMASAETLLQLIQGCDAAAATLLLVGHNPGFEDLALMLVSQGDATLRAALDDKFPTATLAQIEFDVADWPSVKARSGLLRNFTRPRDLGFSLDDEG
jgi:phosphohistidine phosphatase